MSDKTGISFCDATWNTLAGCTKIGQGCTHCYAEQMARRLRGMGVRGYADVIGPHGAWSNKVVCLEHKLDQPLHWRRPRTIFVNSMGDTFHDDVPFTFIRKIFDVIEKCPQHTFMLFTKRWGTALTYKEQFPKNVHLYFSASTQPEVDEAVPILLQIPVAVRGLSLEPLIGPVHLPPGRNLRSVIIGAESGPNRRPCKIEWIESIVNQCSEAGVDCYVKQMHIDGKVCGDPKKFPENLRVRSMPK